MQEEVCRASLDVRKAGIAIKSVVGKLTFSQTDVTTGITDLRLRVLPFSFDHALEFFDLPLHHPDPFDRQIIAQALFEDIPVVTCDEKFRQLR